MAGDGDNITIPWQPGMGPESSASTATAAPEGGAGLSTSPAPVSTAIPEQPLENMKDPETELKEQSWGAKVYHGILNALGGSYNTQYIPTANGVVKQQVANTPGQQWKNIISGALTGFSSAAQAAGTGPGSTMRAAGAGVAGGYRQRVEEDQNAREEAMKTATSNAQTAMLTHQIAESTWRLANSQRQATDEIVAGANTFNQLLSNGGPGSTDLGSMSWQDAQQLGKEWPQLHHEQASGRIITMPEIDPETQKATGKVRAAWVTNDWMNAKTTEDYKFVVPTPDDKGKVEYKSFTIPAGAYTNGDMTKLVMSQGSEWGKTQLEQARLDEEKRRTEQQGRIIPSEIERNEAEATKSRAEGLAAEAKAAAGNTDVDWGPGGQKGFAAWHDRNVTPALAAEKTYRLASNVYNEYTQLRKQGKDFPSGAQSVQMLSYHMANTFGNVKGARITKDLIEKHLGARGVSDTLQVAVQKIVDGDTLSPNQWDAYFSMVNQNRAETWRSVLDDADALGRPTDYVAFPSDLRERWGLGPGHIPQRSLDAATGTAQPAAAAKPAGPGAAAGAAAQATPGPAPSNKSVRLSDAMQLPQNKGKSAEQVRADIVAHGHSVIQ